MRLSSLSNTIAVWAKLSGSGSIHCAAYPTSFALLSLDLIYILKYSSASDGLNVSSLTITGLTPFKEYRVYCYVSKQSAVSKISEVLRTAQSINTTCCKTLTVGRSASSIPSSQSAVNLLSLTLNALPSDAVTVQVISNSSLVLFSPRSFSVARDSGQAALHMHTSLQALPPGIYSYRIVLSGPSAAEYVVQYSSGSASSSVSAMTDSILVLSNSQEPPLVRLQTAIFTDDGSSITISFDSNTNRGNVQGSFPCGVLFIFPCSAASQCRWLDSKSVLAVGVARGGSCAVPTDRVSLALHAAIKAACPLRANALSINSVACPLQSLWKNASTVLSVSILAPVNPLTPNVVVSAPSAIGSCDNLTLDATSSSGSGGRPWRSVSITVEGSPGSLHVSTLQSFLSQDPWSILLSSPHKQVPGHLFTHGSIYTFQVQLCNFLGACGSAVRSMAALAAPVPLLSLLGEPLRIIYRSAVLVVDSSVTVSVCLPSITTLSYSWGILIANSSVSASSVGVKSISRDPSKFILPAYSLQAGAAYTVALSLGGASASVGILVAVGSLHSVVSGGLFRSMREQATLTLDASQSYDDDVATLTGVRAGLRFAWYICK